MLEVTNIVTLSDDNQYVVVSKAIYENVTYYYMVDINNNENFKLLYEDNDELVEVVDDELAKNLLPKFLETIKGYVPEDVLNEMRDTITPEILNQLKNEQE